MGDNDGGGITLQRVFHHLAGVDGSPVNGAAKQPVIEQEFVLVVEEQHMEVFPLFQGERQCQIIFDNLRCREGCHGGM